MIRRPESDPTRSVTAALPGMTPGAHKRNVLVAFGYLVTLAVGGSAVLAVL